MVRYRVIALAALAAVACRPSSRRDAAAPGEDTRMDRALAALRPAVIVQGDRNPRWTLAQRMQHYHVPGVSIAVIDSGRIVYARGFGVKEAGRSDPVTSVTRFEAGSISKPTFTLGVMRLVQDGALNLDQDVNTRLTSWHVPQSRFIRARRSCFRIVR